MLTMPAHDLDIIVIFNRMDCNASAMALKVVDAMLESSGLAPALAAASAEAHRHLIGRWYSAATRRMYGIVSHPVEGQTPVLALSVQHQLLGMLKPVEGVLSMSSPAHGTVEVRVPGDDASQPETLEIIDSGHLERCERLPASPPSTIALAGEIVGTYRYADFGREVSVMLEDGVLYQIGRASCRERVCQSV